MPRGLSTGGAAALFADVINFDKNHFDLFGLPLQFRFDPAVLDRAYRALQSEVHPDRFARGSDAERRMALQSSARVNEAYRALKDPVRRAQYLLRLHDVETISETDTQLPLEFLERQLARREAASEAAAGGDVRALSALLSQVRDDAREIEDRLAHMLDAERAYEAARTGVRELTFLAKLAEDLDAMLATMEDG